MNIQHDEKELLITFFLLQETINKAKNDVYNPKINKVEKVYRVTRDLESTLY
jgi:hypothetical protein